MTDNRFIEINNLLDYVCRNKNLFVVKNLAI